MGCCGLWRRGECVLPTRRGWLVLGFTLAALSLLLALGLHRFLAVRSPFDTGPVVVEGWANSDTLRGAIEELRRHGEPVLYVTGVALDDELAAITHYTSHAELGARRLQELGLRSEQVQAIPASRVRRDRTFASGLALRQWMESRGGVPPRLTLVSEGPHARRSRMLFQQAFDRTAAVGILAVNSEEEREHWWWT